MPDSSISPGSPASSEIVPPGVRHGEPFAKTRLDLSAEKTVGTGPTLVPDIPVELAPRMLEGMADYHILGELGRGGMGVVYKAIQLGLNRPVALKMILAGGHAGPEALARFRREAEVIARLQHPNIVQVYEIGEHEGRPYFSLEYVSGGSLACYLRGTPQTATDAAVLVETLARAMYVVHQQGIIHRDLKPANILLTFRSATEAHLAGNTDVRLSDCVLKITDFGLAKQDSSELTASNAAVGTPSYMSPEQAQGSRDITALSDVYALGAILYELLTGRPPFRGATPLDTVVQVATEEPVPPRQLQPLVPRDVETICLKCLRKEPARRYGSALALAEDLRAFREGRPITARPVGGIERAWRWCRRNRSVAALLATVFLALLTAIVSLSIGLWVAQHQRAEIERRNRLYREALDEQTSSLLEDLLARQKTLTEEHKELLRRTLARYEEFTRESAGDTASRAGLAEAFHRVGRIRYRLGDNTEGEAAYRQAITLQEGLFAEQTSPDRVHPWARMRINLARLLSDQGRVKEAEDILRDVLAKVDLGRGTAAEQREALEIHSMGQRIRFRVLEATGHTAEGETVLLASAKAYDGLLALEPNSSRYRAMSLAVRLELGAAQGKLGELDASEQTFRALVPALEQLIKDQPEETDLRSMLAAAHTNRAENALLRKQPELAETSLRAALGLYAELSAGFPANPAHRHDLAGTYFRLARLLRSRRQYRQAETEARTALQLQAKLAAEFPDHLEYSIGVANARHLLATVLDFLDHVSEADAEFQAALAAQEKLAASHPTLTRLAVSLGGQYSDYGIFLMDRRGARQALPWHDKAVACLTPLVQQEPNLLEARRNLLAAHRCRAYVQTALDHPAEAARDWERVLSLEEKPRRDFRLHYAIALAHAKRSADALAAAEPVLTAADLTGEESYLGACLYGQAAMTEAEPMRKEQLAALAVKQLQAAHRLKWFAKESRREQLRKEPALAGLQSRTDFQQLLADINSR